MENIVYAMCALIIMIVILLLICLFICTLAQEAGHFFAARK